MHTEEFLEASAALRQIDDAKRLSYNLFLASLSQEEYIEEMYLEEEKEFDLESELAAIDAEEEMYQIFLAESR
jgi:hypothetical protein